MIFILLIIIQTDIILLFTIRSAGWQIILTHFQLSNGFEPVHFILPEIHVLS